MARPQLRKSGKYEFRKVVPARLRALVGKREVTVNLETKDPKEALRRHAVIEAELDAEWERLEAGVDPETAPAPPMLKQEHIAALSGLLYHRLMRLHGSEPGPEQRWVARLEEIQLALPERNRTNPNATAWNGWVYKVGPQAARLFGGAVDALLLEKDTVVDRETRTRICMAAATATAQAYRELIKRARNDFSPDPDAARFPDWRAPTSVKTTAWREVHALYAKERQVGAASVKRQIGVLKEFFAFLGHDDMAMVDKSDVERWVEHRLGKNAPSTVRDADLAHPKTLFLWGLGKGHIHHRPFEGVRVFVPEQEVLREREFYQEEAEAILAATLIPPGSGMREAGAGARRWVPWICAYSGARVNEITQARSQDVVQRKSHDGTMVWCIHITPEAGTVKNRKARWVALHPHLIEQGFLDYVARRDGKALFYDPELARGGSPANPQYKKVGERLADWVRTEVGITDTGVDPNHGWRHLFRSNMLAARVQEQIINRIDGHTAKNVAQRYGAAWPKVMLTAISRIPRYRVGGP